MMDNNTTFKNNSTTDYSASANIVTIVNCVFNAVLMLIAIVGNSLVIAAILRTPTLRAPFTTLLCSLAVSDLLVGLVLQPLYIANALTGNTPLKRAFNTTVFSVCGVSLLTMAVISVDRFLALHYHMRYPYLMTTHYAI